MIGSTNAANVVRGGAGVEIYHIVQTIDGDECSLAFTNYDPAVTTDNYLVAIYIEGTSQRIFILEEVSS